MSFKAIINNQFRVYAAQKFIEGLLETQLSNNNLFLWIGKVKPWSNDSNPDQPNDTVSARLASYADMIAMKKVSPSDVSLVIPRNNWTASTVYSQYSDQGAIYSGVYYDQYEPLTGVNPFFVVTDENNIYKCLGNNNGAVSSVKPTGTGTSNIVTGDGYTWKFMYQLSSQDIQKFLTTSWIPIHYIPFNDGSLQWTVQQTAVSGAIEIINLTAGGTGYGSAPTVTVTGDGTGCTATATVTTGVVTAITIVTKGTGYTHATVSFGGPGINAAATAVISPPGGHGSDPINELGAMYALVSVKLQYDESGKITVSNDFRKFGLVINPQKFGNGQPQLYTSLIGTVTTNLTLTSVTGTFSPDDVVTGATSTATGIVVDYTSGTGVLRVAQVAGTFTTEPLNDTTSSASATVSTIRNPDVKANSGAILQTEHMTPITRNPTQLEDFKIVIPF
jgi:hypothetical protein